jgi:DNA-binding NarL/FixJ family response regulator
MEIKLEIILAYANVFSRDLIIEESHQRDETMEILPANRISEVTALINRGVSPALIILDSGLSDIKGLAGLTRTLEVTRREVPIAIMGAPTSNSEMRMVLEAGAMGYIPKNIGIKAFFSALTLMIEGQIFMPQESSHHNNEKHFLPINDLTGRELDMLSGLLAGKSDKEIAIKYGIALVTVKHHLKSLRGKLGAKNRTHAVCRAIELGLTQEASES